MRPLCAIKGFAAVAGLAVFTLAAHPAFPAAKMAMPMAEGPSHFPVAKEVLSAHHRFVLKILSVPKPIPFERYFTLMFKVEDAHHQRNRLRGVRLTLFAGMRHGLKHGFAHGMQSSPKISEKRGVFTVRGMYFHMMGPWTLKLTIRAEGKEDVAYLQLPCCGK